MSGSLNKVSLIGRVGKDPVGKSIPSGARTVSFSVATDESWKDKSGSKQERTEWHNVVAWGKLAELVESYVKKGSKVYLEGKLRHRSYEKDGVTKYVTEVEAQELVFLDSKGASSARTETQSAPSASDSSDDSLPF